MFELIAATICSIHFMFHDFDDLRRAYIYIYLGVGLTTIIITMFDFFISARFNMLVIILYGLLFLFSFTISIHWVVVANIEEVEIICKPVLMGFMFMTVGFGFFLAKFPECYVQRNKLVDYFLQSHSIWHLCCLGCVLSFYTVMNNYNEIIKKKI